MRREVMSSLVLTREVGIVPQGRKPCRWGHPTTRFYSPVKELASHPSCRHRLRERPSVGRLGHQPIPECIKRVIFTLGQYIFGSGVVNDGGLHCSNEADTVFSDNQPRGPSN